MNLTLEQTEGKADARQYIEDIVADVLEEHPTEDEDEIKRLVEEQLE